MLVRIVVLVALLVSGLAAPPAHATPAGVRAGALAAATTQGQASVAAKAKPRAVVSGTFVILPDGRVRASLSSTSTRVTLTWRTVKNKKRASVVKVRRGAAVKILPKGSKTIVAQALATRKLRTSVKVPIRAYTPPVAPRPSNLPSSPPVSPPPSSPPVSPLPSPESTSPEPTSPGANPLINLPQLAWFGGPSWYAQFPKSAAWNNPNFFPIGAWWNDFAHDAEVKWDKSVGLNFYVQLNGEEDASLLGRNGMYWMGDQFGSLSDNDPAWVGNYLEDEIDGQYPDVNDAYAAIEQLLKRTSEGRFDANNYTAIVTSEYNEAQQASSEKFVNMISGPVSVDAYYYTGEWCHATGDDYRNYQLGGFDQSHCATSASYGQSVRALRVRDMVDGKPQPLFSFVESGAPYENGRYITPDQMKGAVWNSIIAGANGILWFPQSFSGDCVTGSSIRLAQYSLGGGCANENILNGMKVVNLQVQALAPVLNTPSYDYTFGANLDTMLKWHHGSAYVFSMISGESTSFAGSRTFTLPSALAGVSSVEVVNEDRTIPVNDGTFSDDFQHEYTYHIYRITPSSPEPSPSASEPGPSSEPGPPYSDALVAELREVAGLPVFFGHQSVGQNLHDARPGVYTRANLEAHVIGHHIADGAR